MEILIVVTLLGIIAAIAVPGLRNWKENADLNSDMRRLYAFFQKSRVEAVKRNTTCLIVFNQVVNGANFDYVSFIDGNGNNTFEDGEVVVHSANLNGGDAFADAATAAYTGSYDQRGLINSNVTLNVVSTSGTQHSLVINNRGRMRIQ